MTTPVYLAPRPRGIAPLKQRPGAIGHDLLPRPALPPHGPHAVVLRGLGPERGLGPLQPTFTARTEDDFIAAVQAALAEPGGAQRLADAMAQLPRDDAGHYKFFPPVQRVHQLVLVEACCAQPGFPRVDPRRIDSAGLVLRRPLVDPRQVTPSWLAWQRRGEQPIGWGVLAARPGPGGVSELEDPDAARRAPLERSGNAHIDAKLHQLAQQRSLTPLAATAPSERVVPLHPLPEALCAALGRTILVGYLPVASDEVVDSAEPTRAAPDAADVQALQGHLMHYLRAGGVKALPRAGEVITPSWLEAIAQAPDGTGDVPGALAAGRWVQTLMQLHLEFDIASTVPDAAALQQVFNGYRAVWLDASAKAAASSVSSDMPGAWVSVLSSLTPDWRPEQAASLPMDTSDPRFFTAEVRALLNAWVASGSPHPLGISWSEIATQQAPETETWLLERIRQFLVGCVIEPALPFVRNALDAVLGDDPPAQRVYQPDYWAPVSAELDAAFARAATERVRQREAALFSGAGKRLSEPGVALAVRCFVRLKSPNGCPPTLAWSAYSDLFSVAPWWESGGAKPRVIDMPDPFDRGVLRKLKPNVGFAMPGKLGQLMTPANLDKLKNGEKPGNVDVAIDWICGFNIPIITLCALIVLNIFLQLMNIIFWWLPFVKLCLPIPRKK